MDKPEVAEGVLNQIVKAFMQRKAVFDEGFLAFGGLLTIFGRQIKDQLPEFYQYIQFGLESDIPGVIRTSCSAIGDIQINECGEVLIPKMREYVPLLIKHLKSTDIERTVKVRCISALAETYQLAGKEFESHIDETMKIFISAAGRCQSSGIQDSDQEMVGYIKVLQTALLEAFTLIIQEIDE